jgi:hypothetical protein
MFSLDPIPKGIANALFTVALSSLATYFFFQTIPPASAELLRTIAVIGASLFIAYVVEAVWLVSRVAVHDEYEQWLGFLIGTGIAGLLGIVAALLLSEHRAAGHANFIDSIGTSWILISMIILGALLVIQPLLAYELSEPAGRDDDELS